LGRVSGQNSHSLTIKRLGSRSNSFKQSWVAEDAHHSFEVVREHMKAHLGTYPWQSFSQEVGGSHPIFERYKRILNSLTASLHLPWVIRRALACFALVRNKQKTGAQKKSA